MRWTGGRRGGNVEDRRGMSPGAAGGGGLGLLVLLVVGYFLLKGMGGGGPAPEPASGPSAELPGRESPFGNGSSAPSGETMGSATSGASDDAGVFVDVVSANINDVWGQLMEGYTPPRVVLYEQGTQTGCGYGQSAMGPFYCPQDQSVYVDLSFWDEMKQKFGASNAEFARAYVIAHEYGHHVQLLTGVAQKVRAAQSRARSQEEANAYQVAMELQADCYAGVWAVHAATVSNGEVALEPGDAEEGLKTAQAIGDDMIQRRMTGRVTPEGFTHGSSKDRVEWLYRGLKTGDPASCDTFK